MYFLPALSSSNLLFIIAQRRLSFLLFLTISILLSACSSSNDRADSRETSVRLITHNVWYGFTKNPDRKSSWLEWVRMQHPDIVFLQELNEYTPEQLQKDATHWGHPYSKLLKEEGFPTGMTSRFPIEDIHIFLDGFHHGLMRAKIGDLYVYNIHLHPSNWEFRKLEVDLLLRDIQRLPADAYILLAGDFNTFSPYDSVYYAHGLLEPFFAGLDSMYNNNNLNQGRLDYSALQTLMDNGFSDVEYLNRAPDYQFEGSFPTLIEKEGEHGSRRRLDYVFVNEQLLPRVDTAFIVVNDTTEYLSDHLPVVVELEVKPHH